VNYIVPYNKIFAATWAIVILVLSLLPPGAFEIFNWNLLSRDKLLHTLAYSVLSFIVYDALLASSRINYSKLHLIVRVSIVCIAYGILMECLQYLENLGRIFDSGDIIANAFGTCVGIIIYSLFKHFKLKLRL
jgi:glycopeptide antibiotics resistance protein